MGEYALYQGEVVKIGTCESMYYLRYEDRNKVTKLPSSVDPRREVGLFWRIPFPDEDHIQIGHYADYDRGERLFRRQPGDAYSTEFELPDADPGIVQLTHPCGLLVNVPCYHGLKLPEVQTPMRVFWNGKSWFAELVHIKNTEEGLFPVVHCRFCKHMWRYDWEKVLPFVYDVTLRARLEAYANRREQP